MGFGWQVSFPLSRKQHANSKNCPVEGSWSLLAPLSNQLIGQELWENLVGTELLDHVRRACVSCFFLSPHVCSQPKRQRAQVRVPRYVKIEARTPETTFLVVPLYISPAKPNPFFPFCFFICGQYIRRRTLGENPPPPPFPLPVLFSFVYVAKQKTKKTPLPLPSSPPTFPSGREAIRLPILSVYFRVGTQNSKKKWSKGTNC